jgi:Uma2 family endonuclease
MTATAQPAATSIPDIGEHAAHSDLYRYGWRYVRRDLPDGNYVMEQAPLALEDVLHPEEGDQVTHSDAHQRRCVYLYDVFRARVSDDPTAVVLHHVRIAWDVPELQPHGPDIMVIFGVRERKNWTTFDVGQEGVRPALIVEVVSPDYASLDRSNKLEEYDMAGVPLYVIVDTVRQRERTLLRLLGYRQTAAAYAPLAPDERGWLWLEPLKLWLGIRDDEVYCFDEAGAQIGDYTAVTAAHAAVTAALTAERQARAEAEDRATAAEARLHALEEELRRLRGES